MNRKMLASEKAGNFLNRCFTIRQLIFTGLMITCFFTWMTPPVALLLGILAAQFIGHPFLRLNHKITHILLQFSVVGLGFGMDVGTAFEAGSEGFVLTFVSIAGVLTLGYFLGRKLEIDKKTSLLISAGTAICGGSAIAAISPVIKAKEREVSVALGTIFILNSVALFIFPFIGQALAMSQKQFGTWSAISIQDTSSVVGAAAKFGTQALQIATTVKLTRALWIVPVAFLCAWIFKSKDAKIKVPYFIGLFLLAVVVNTYVPAIKSISSHIVHLSKIGLTLTLFLIGSGLSRHLLVSVGARPVLQGIILWMVISVASLAAVLLMF